jgi:hypothetical protein
MRSALLCSVTLIAIGLMAGCGSSSGGGGTVPPQPDALDGQYAFVLSGFDSTGKPMGMAGSFKADGLGHITAGEIDVNDNGTQGSSTSLTGSYSFDANQLGALVTVAFTNSVTNVAHPLAFGIALQASGAFGNIMSLDANNFIVGGTIQKQDSSVFSLSSLMGDYIITLNGRNAAVPTSALGRFTLAADGTSTKVLFDRSIAGVNTAAATSAVVTFASAGPDTNGRGTLTVTINDTLVPASGTQNFDYYAITANRFVAVETDATGTMIADGSRQANLSSFTVSTVFPTGSVFGVAGVDTTVANGNEISAVGQLQITGANAGTLSIDSNDKGTIASVPALPIQTASFDSTTGRGMIAATGGSADGLFDSAVFYLTASGTGFILDAEPTSSNRAMAGTLSAQSGSPFALSAISGQMILRARGSTVNDAQTLVGTIGPTATPGIYNFAFDQDIPPGPPSTDQDIVAGVLAQISAPATGRGTLSIPTGPTTSATEVFYLIGANQMVFIDVTPGGGASPVFFVNAY